MNIYTDLEVLLDIQIPQCVKTILYHSGFDTELSIENLNESLLLQSEKDVNSVANKTFKTIFNGIQCCFSETYREDIHKQQFKFIESHRELILNLPEKILLKNSLQGTETTLCLKQLKDISKQFKENPALPNMIGELLETAIANYKKTPNLNRYSNVVKDFATYIYLLCGRLSYEVLSCNLSMPAATTVCKSSFRIYMCICVFVLIFWLFEFVVQVIPVKYAEKFVKKFVMGYFNNYPVKSKVSIETY